MEAVPECAICHAPLETGLVALSGCGHVFHGPCLTKWLKIKPPGKRPQDRQQRCPICRDLFSEHTTVTLHYTLDAERLNFDGDSHEQYGRQRDALIEKDQKLHELTRKLEQQESEMQNLAGTHDSLLQLVKNAEADAKRHKAEAETLANALEGQKLQRVFERDLLAAAKLWDCVSDTSKSPDDEDDAAASMVMSQFEESTNKDVFVRRITKMLNDLRRASKVHEAQAAAWKYNREAYKTKYELAVAQLEEEKSRHNALRRKLEAAKRRRDATEKRAPTTPPSESAEVRPPEKKRRTGDRSLQSFEEFMRESRQGVVRRTG